MDTLTRPPTIPAAPRAIQKGSSLAQLLDRNAIECLALNIHYVQRSFQYNAFVEHALAGIDNLPLMQRAKHIALALKAFLPPLYEDALSVLLASLTPAKMQAEEFGLSGFFYLPHSFFISEFGNNPEYNGGCDPFDLSMEAMRELTMRFTAEFAIRPFFISDSARTLGYIEDWTQHPNPHVRRLCSEGTRPKLPWGIRLSALIKDPEPVIPILNYLKDDETLYVRRSVANHLGDIAKDHPQRIFDLCQSWLEAGSNKELNWVIRHALRYPAKKEDAQALALRQAAR